MNANQQFPYLPLFAILCHCSLVHLYFIVFLTNIVTLFITFCNFVLHFRLVDWKFDVNVCFLTEETREQIVDLYKSFESARVAQILKITRFRFHEFR